ncbi:MAG TPA: trypsin-like peptidase domain-containing protein [Gemmataceae bacterium]|jgi:S1-C subfamily serine protease
MPRTCLLALAVALLPGPVAAADPAASVVKVAASVRYPNPVRPWVRNNPIEVIGTGVVLDGKRILTSAHLVLYATEVTVQSRPGADKTEATVAVVAPDADLAVLTVKDDKFFAKYPALPRAAKLPKVQDAVTVYGFPVGGNDLSVTRGVVSRIDFGTYGVRGGGLYLQVSAAVNPGNSGGPAVVDGAMVGVVASRLNEAEGIGFIIPNEEIDLVLANVQGGRYVGKPVEAAGTGYQRLENPALRRFVKLDDSVKGVLISAPDDRPDNYPLRTFDVLTKIGPHEIDNEGMVRLDESLRVPFTCLIPKLARGPAVPVTVLRGGKTLTLDLPVTRRDDRLIREFEGEQPSYFIHGPLVFSPLKSDAVSLYARMNPGLYGAGGPLITRRLDKARFPGEELVVVTAPMFAHKIAKGYGDPVGLVVRDVNGVAVKNLRHLVETLRDSTAEFLTFRFADEPGTILVFDRKEMDKATEEIMEDNGIAPSRRGSADVLAAWKAGPSR